MKPKLAHVLSIVGLTIATNALAQDPVWTLSGFAAPESAFFDEARNTIYVSNINGGGTDKDGNGYISRVSYDGQLQDAKWVTGLDAPKGLASDGNTLYVADIDRLVAIDIETGTISGSWSAEGAVFLNDTAVDAQGLAYVSDTVKSSIYVLANNTLSVLATGKELQHPNGLHLLDDKLLVAPWGKGMNDDWSTEAGGYLYTVQLSTGNMENHGSDTPVGNLDGLEPDGKGNWIVSDWRAGKIYRILSNGSMEQLLSLEQGSADLEYIVEQSLLIVPMMLNESVVAYRIE